MLSEPENKNFKLVTRLCRILNIFSFKCILNDLLMLIQNISVTKENFCDVVTTHVHTDTYTHTS